MRKAALVLVLPWLAASATHAEDRSFDEWLTDEIQSRVPTMGDVQVAAGSRSPSNQLEAPAMAASRTTLVDTTSVSDLVGIALNLAGLTGASEDDSEDATSASASVSGYAFYSAFTGSDPLDPEVYCEAWAQRFRRISGSLGYDDPEGPEEQSMLFGAKWTLPFLGRGNICDSGAQGDFSKVQQALEDALQAYGDTGDEVQLALWEATKQLRNQPQLGFDAFLDEIEDPEKLAQVLAAIPTSQRKQLLDERIDASMEGRLDAAVQEALREFELQPRFAVEFMSRQRDGTGDEYAVTGILDAGLPGLPFALTLNGGWQQRTQVGSDNHGGRAALALDYELPHKRLEGARRIRLGLAGSGRWLTGMEDQYVGQLKVVIPILDGIEIPMSMTVASRTDLVDEAEVRGLVGFTVDVSRLIPLLGRRMSASP
jgi:hypothetical protein